MYEFFCIQYADLPSFKNSVNSMAILKLPKPTSTPTCQYNSTTQCTTTKLRSDFSEKQVFKRQHSNIVVLKYKSTKGTL